jgi:two-component system chemotaxis sensor kinase CheA
MDDQLLREFLAEAEDLIEILIGDIQALRARRNEGRARRELIARIFRHVHTIKGSSAAAGLNTTTEIAHEFETLLDGLRLGRVAVDDAVLDALDEGVNVISQTLGAAARGETLSTPQTLIERLRRLALKGGAESRPSAATAALAALPEELARSLSEYEEHRLREAAEEGARLYVVTVSFDLATFDERFRDLSDALAEGGELISTLPGLEGARIDQINFRIVYATNSTAEEISALVAPFGDVILTALTSEQQKQAETITDEAAAGEATLDEQVPASIAPLSTLVRVKLNELDEMVSAAHELLTDTTGALDLALSANLARAERTELEIRAARIRRHFVELEERLIELRMVPVGHTLVRAARAGTKAARSIGKEILIETSGGEVRLDKSLADAISDPLLHLLRNAVDHGIEPAAERTSAGKSAQGRIHITAMAEGSRVLLRVEDDGRGIDPERVRAAAIERGVIKAAQKLTAQQSLRLIFRPGFSTAQTVSDVSGRGVGLDVVERTVEQFGGQIHVRSLVGKGTTFEMLLPTTLALVPSLLIRSEGYRYCVDVSHITEAGIIQRSEVERVGDQRVTRWRGSVVPFVEMRELLAQETVDQLPDNEPLHVIISRIGGQHEADTEDAQAMRRAAVRVDGWDGHHEVLVRGLGKHSARWRGVGGATELDDGTVALVLDLPRLLEMTL